MGGISLPTVGTLHYISSNLWVYGIFLLPLLQNITYVFHYIILWKGTLYYISSNMMPIGKLTCGPVMGLSSAVLDTVVSDGTATVRPLGQVQGGLGAIGGHKLELGRRFRGAAFGTGCLSLRGCTGT